MLGCSFQEVHRSDQAKAPTKPVCWVCILSGRCSVVDARRSCHGRLVRYRRGRGRHAQAGRSQSLLTFYPSSAFRDPPPHAQVIAAPSLAMEFRAPTQQPTDRGERASERPLAETGKEDQPDGKHVGPQRRPLRRGFGRRGATGAGPEGGHWRHGRPSRLDRRNR